MYWEKDKKTIAVLSSDYQNGEFSFEFLPLEIIIKILRYLPLKDIKSATLTCKHWREAIKHPKLQKKFYLELSLSKILSYQNLITIFENSTSKYTELNIDTCYRQLEFTDIYQLIRNAIPIALRNIKCLTFDRTKLRFDSLCLTLSQMTSLNHLKITSSDLYFENEKNPIDCQKTIENLQIFEMEKSNINSYDGLAEFLSMTSNLEELNISYTAYGSRGKSSKQSVMLSNIIQRNYRTLKRVYLKSFEFGEPFLRICNINSTKSPLNLEALTVFLDHRAGPFIDEFENFLCQQVNLKYLDVCTFPNFQLIPESLKNLKHLRVYACLDDLRNFDLHVISKFDSLKTLKLKGLGNINNCIKPKLNNSLKVFKLEMVNISGSYIENLGKTFTNLQVLELSLTKVCDETMQSIIKNLKLLKHLQIDSFKGSDFGVTGFDSVTGKQVGVPITCLQNLEDLKIFYTHAFQPETITNYFKLKNLKTFYFENTKIRWKYSLPVEYVIDIIKNCPKLETLRFAYHEEVSSHDIKKLLDVFKSQNRIISREFKNCINIKNLK